MKYRCWADGEDEHDDSEVIDEYAAKCAAEEYAQKRMDMDGPPYEMTVFTRKLDSDGPVRKWNITVDWDPVFHASEEGGRG